MSNQFFEGNIPEGWEVRTISSFGKVITGKTPPTQDKENFGKKYPFITPRDMKGQKHVKNTERYLSEKAFGMLKNNALPKDSVCVSCIGSDMGKVVVTTRISLTNQQLNSVITRNINPNFVYYALLDASKRLRSMAFHSTAVPILNKSDFSAFEVIAPKDPAEANSISSVLCSLDKKIELLNEENTILEDIGQTIFKRWFVDFEFPKEEGEPYKSSGGEMVGSELGLIPITWHLSKIGSVLKTHAGGTPSRSKREYWESGEIPWIASGKINEFRIIEPTEYITLRGLENSSAKIVPKRTVVLALIGATVGQVSILEIESSINQNILAIIGSDDLPSEYVYFWIKNIIVKIIASQSGGAQQSINKKIVDNSSILIPSNFVMHEFYSLIRSIFDKIALNCFESKSLEKIRDTLLPKLMSGKIRVPVQDGKGLE